MTKVPEPDVIDCHWYCNPPPVAVNVNVAICLASTVALCGCWVIDGTVGGLRLTVATANLVVSAILVAVIVKVSDEAIEAGAVYKPVAVMEPLLVGVIVQVTSVRALPVTVAVNCCVSEGNRVAVVGLMVTETGAL